MGDFALFVSYIAWLSQVTSMFGNYLTQYRQTGVSIDRLLTLLQDAPPEALVAPLRNLSAQALPGDRATGSRRTEAGRAQPAREA